MTLYILIKKEIIQFLRNKTDVLTMFIFPIILIVVMGTALNGLMNVDKNIFENKDIYYKKSGTKDEELYNIFINFKKSCTDTIKVNFIEVKDNIIDVRMHIKGAEFLKAKKTDVELEKIIKNLFGIEYKILLHEVISESEILEYQRRAREEEEKLVHNAVEQITKHEEEMQAHYEAKLEKYS